MIFIIQWNLSNQTRQGTIKICQIVLEFSKVCRNIREETANVHVLLI